MPPVLIPTFTKYDKFIYASLGIVVIVGNQIIGSADLGLSPVITHWISIGVGGLTMFLTLAQPNKNMVSLPPDHVVVHRDAVIPGSIITAKAA